MCTLENPAVINISISDYILTPASCASLVNEVMKNLLYQRAQIPYPYAWLKNIVKKKRKSLEEGEEENKNNFTLSKHYQTVSTAYDAVENITSNIVKCFTGLGDNLKEVIFVIGVTPVCPKEVFTVKASSLALGHVEGNHVMENSRRQSRILRSIFLEEN
ncbi:MAD2L1-binding protein isoform X2 [Tribolium madens]|uniref:MAD2L1-binding protein isoform X2 n=1 Tax=Tribolium madens TaxID=41895 RepID=UPI001CF72937|nr:MAD2L1-binding protein isoform X2 [Tribolium madens]